jgi:predicted transcriptional regulator
MTQLSYQEVLSNQNSDVDAASQVLALVREFPFRTARELANKVNENILTADNVHKRLPELRRAGKVLNANRRRCTITGRTAITWMLA